MKYTRLLTIILNALLTVPGIINAQCNTPISTFPYVEDFENSAAWTTGGTKNDWAWGNPNKTYIKSAGSGTKCWVTGGLTGSFYNYSEASWVQSPCFDFTNVVHPYIQFLIWWESERDFDGTNLEYSLNQGGTWQNVGAFGDAVDCLNQNWFNESSITYLQGLANPQSGWCGSVLPPQGSCHGGSGSGGWKTASHCMSYLAGQSSVIFRFTFGAGTTCNSFDGVAFDSVAIGEAPANSGTFSYVCNSSSSITFTSNAILCPNNYAWDFGDPASGSSNSATTVNASHTFSAAGTYAVTLNLSGPCNAAYTTNQVVNIMNAIVHAQQPACNDTNSTGSVFIDASGGTGPYSYNWADDNTDSSRTGLIPGIYVVTVSQANGCPVEDSIVITRSSIGISQNQNLSGCGEVTINNKTFFTDTVYNDTLLSVGGCDSIYQQIAITVYPLSQVHITPSDTTITQGDTVRLMITPGNFSSILWSSSNGLSDSSISYIIDTPQTNTIYQVFVTDSNNCPASDSTTVKVEPVQLVYAIPSAFTPNGDGHDDTFMPVFLKGKGSLVEMHVYNRWGQLIYNSNDPKGWDGTFKGASQPVGTYVYYIVIKDLNLNTISKKEGSVTLMR